MVDTPCQETGPAPLYTDRPRLNRLTGTEETFDGSDKVGTFSPKIISYLFQKQARSGIGYLELIRDGPWSGIGYWKLIRRRPRPGIGCLKLILPKPRPGIGHLLGRAASSKAFGPQAGLKWIKCGRKVRPTRVSRFQGRPTQAKRFQDRPTRVSRLQGRPTQANRFQGRPTQVSRFQGRAARSLIALRGAHEALDGALH